MVMCNFQLNVCSRENGPGLFPFILFDLIKTSLRSQICMENVWRIMCCYSIIFIIIIILVDTVC